jgi:hypothetical protein
VVAEREGAPAVRAPSISLPTGGGAIRGIGEKFSNNPFTGTGAMTVPIATSPGRGGFGPSLALSYDSGAGNGPFGFGWSLGLPAISRKTDRGLPRYRDDEDVFLLGEDLVPVDGGTPRDGYMVRRYQPRIEGAFARIERWSRTGDTFWRSISRDNITTLYGATVESRVVDAERIFSWLVCEVFDDKGNVLVYEYSADGAARYLSRARYGNRTARGTTPMVWSFDVELDYTTRPDPYSSYRAGFDVRTARRCSRIRMLHRFPELGAAPYLVRSMELDYADLDYTIEPAIDVELAHRGSTRRGSVLTRIMQQGHADDVTRSLPPLELEYSRAEVQDTIRGVDNTDNLPVGLDGRDYQWVDLDGEGLSGVLAEQAGGWFYKRNVSTTSPRFDPIEIVGPVPTPLTGGQQWLDVSGDGQLDVVQFGGTTPGYFARTTDASWQTLASFDALPNVAFDDPNARLVDLSGDGLADLLVPDGEIFTWYPSLAARGYGAAEHVSQGPDGPKLVFADGTRSIYLADMSGDGLSDLVRVRNGDVCYWPNLGYGKFGAKITMENAPWFDVPEQFDQRRVRIADVDGSGTSDLLYLGAERVAIYFNRAGNGFCPPRWLHGPIVDDPATVTIVDLLGNGTSCLVWSSPFDHVPMRYVSLVGAQKPHLLIGYKNNLGARAELAYEPSTRFYLADKQAGRPWITRVPFPIHCVARVTIYDAWRGSELTTTYSYHHGYYDGDERELRGFARVEQVDVQLFEGGLDQPPVKTITWFHTGAFLDRARILSQLAHEYARPAGVVEHAIPEPQIAPALSTAEWREALRACKGNVLRREVYELDGAGLAVKLVETSSHGYEVQALAPRVFLVTESEVVTYHHEPDHLARSALHVRRAVSPDHGDRSRAPREPAADAGRSLARKRDVAGAEWRSERSAQLHGALSLRRCRQHPLARAQCDDGLDAPLRVRDRQQPARADVARHRHAERGDLSVRHARQRRRSRERHATHAMGSPRSPRSVRSRRWRDGLLPVRRIEPAHA